MRRLGGIELFGAVKHGLRGVEDGPARATQQRRGGVDDATMRCLVLNRKGPRRTSVEVPTEVRVWSFCTGDAVRAASEDELRDRCGFRREVYGLEAKWVVARVAPSVPDFATVKREQQCQVVTLSECPDVRVRLNSKYVAPTVENHPDSTDRSLAICQRDLIPAVRRQVFVR
jgi:hypothetical protein